MTVTETAERTAAVEPPEPVETEPAESAELVRYTLFERVLHWVVAITFIALMLSGLALAYPRMAWLSGLFGGGQTMRAAHPWIGVVFTAGLVLMLVAWGRGMWLDRTDRAWFRQMREYARRAHVAVDSGRWNGGQKGYFWASLVFGIVLLVTGLPLWFPSIAGSGIHQLSRLTHHVAFLIMVGGFIIHVLLSAFLFSGTMAGMTSGRVTRAWAAWHHPRWYRGQVADERSAAEHASRLERLAAEEAKDAEDAEATEDTAGTDDGGAVVEPPPDTEP
jgi:formate dehydrogenase subunit gamma